jgi:hypothetical protein
MLTKLKAENLKDRRNHLRPRNKREDNIKMDLKEIK